MAKMVPKIAHHGDGHDAWSRDPDALQDTARDHHLEGGRDHAHEASGHEQDEAGMYGSPASDAVGERAKQNLAEGRPGRCPAHPLSRKI